MAESSIGVVLGYSTDSGTNYTSAGCLLSLDVAGFTRDVKEGTCLSQTSLWKTFFGAFLDAGEITGEIDWVKAQYQAMFNLLDDSTLLTWRIVVPDGTDLATPTTCTRLVCEGLLSKLGLGFPSDGDRIRAPFTIKLSGAPTLTLAS